jgi:hypothetical protein
MPRYRVEMDPGAADRLDGAGRMAAHRFPEIAVEHRCTPNRAPGDRCVWLCRAPSEAHIDRWAAALQLRLASVRRIDPPRPPTSHPTEEP